MAKKPPKMAVPKKVARRRSIDRGSPSRIGAMGGAMPLYGVIPKSRIPGRIAPVLPVGADKVREMAQRLVSYAMPHGIDGPVIMGINEISDCIRELAHLLQSKLAAAPPEWITPCVNGDFPGAGTKVIVRFRSTGARTVEEHNTIPGGTRILGGPDTVSAWRYASTVNWTKEFKRQFDGFEWQWKVLDHESI